MATMASMLAHAASRASAACRASRAAALAVSRAARSVAAARRADAAVSRAARSSTDASAAAAAADLASSRVARPFGCGASMNGRLVRGAGDAAPRAPMGSDSSHIDSCLSSDDKPQTPMVGEVNEFVAEEKDLESDEALWALYERWCKHFNQERDHDEMARRFHEFKKRVQFVHRANNTDRPCKFAINQFTDGKLHELHHAGYNALMQEESARLAKLPSGTRCIWVEGKFYMELPEEFQPDYYP